MNGGKWIVLRKKIASNLKVLSKMTPGENNQKYKQLQEILNTSPECARYINPLRKFGCVQWCADSRNSSGSISTHLLWERRVQVQLPAGARDCSLPLSVQTGYGAHPVSYSMHSRGSFPPGWGEADHSPSCNAKDKNAWSCTSTFQRDFIAWCLINIGTLFLPLQWWGFKYALCSGPILLAYHHVG
jgi:hypothetical protein